MKHTIIRKRDPNQMLQEALEDGWETIDTMPLRGEGVFLVLTVSGLVRLAHNRNSVRRARRADAYGPKRSSVIAEESGNYLAAIAWKWPDK
ncbi:hypothetical protein [Gymnodinialimonas hymeniacidonis]|uniref:hypothetical protein n=1 Tax=Gymnodinialimonas hymeniacidonis TaxID=3126508 RepID=UPI0034C66B07